MGKIFTTDDVPPRERVGRWQEIISELFVRLDCRSPGADAFDGNVEASMLGDIECNRVATKPVNVYRTRHHIARAQGDYLHVAFVTEGSDGIVQDGRETLLEAGDFAFYDTTRPFEVRSGTVAMTIFQVPRDLVCARVGAVEMFTATKFSCRRPLDQLAFQFWNGISRVSDHVTDSIRIRLHDQALDLLAMAIAERQENLPVSSSTHRSVMLYRLKAHIQNRLRDSCLSLSQVAAEFGVSARYINDLLADEQMSFTRYVLSQRLERCRQDLSSNVLTGRQIGEIAFSWGFNDLSHFTRRFKERYGLSPRAYRQGARPPAASLRRPGS
jgi:AraC-like DNA-binding protein